MGGKETGAPLRVDFDNSVKTRFAGAKVSSEAGPPEPVKHWSLTTLREKLACLCR